MGMKLSTIRAKIDTTTVIWGDETVDVGYHPAAVTPAMLEDVQAAAKAEDMNVVGAMLEPVLAWWDVLDDDDQRMPTDAATIRVMPMAFLTAVMERVQEAMSPPEGEG